MIKIAIKDKERYKKLKKIIFFKNFFEKKVYPQKVDSFYVLKNIENLKTSDRPFHKTRANRFNDVDKITIKYLKKNNIKKFHDLAVSCGVTSFDLYQAIKEENIDGIEFVISDKYSDYYFSGTNILKIYNTQKQFVEGSVFCFLASALFSNKYFISKWLFSLLSKTKIAEHKPATILDEKAVELLELGDMEFINYDIFNTRVTDKFDFVRCMNILNNSYFKEKETKKALANILDSLQVGGIIQIGKGEAPNTVSSFYKKNKSGKLLLLEEINGGTEIKQIVKKYFQ